MERKSAFFAWIALSVVLVIGDLSDRRTDGVAYERYAACLPEPDGASAARDAAPALAPLSDDASGATVAVVGGSINGMGAAYFTAAAALRAGAETVHVFCQLAAGPAIQSFSPDVIVHPLFDTNVDKLIAQLEKTDVVVFGPGLDTLNLAHSANVWTRVVTACKNARKPLIVVLEEPHITLALVNSLNKYPAPGVMFLTSGAEFEALYKLVRNPGSFGDARVSVDWEKLGENAVVVRSGCADSAVSADARAAWALGGSGAHRRRGGRAHALAGVAAAYFHRALARLPRNVTRTHGPAFPASAAAFSAARLMRACSRMAREEKGASALTSDILDKLQDALETGADADDR